MSDENENDEKGEKTPESRRKRFSADGSQIFHHRTVRRRNANEQSAIDEQFQDLMRSATNEFVQECEHLMDVSEDLFTDRLQHSTHMEESTGASCFPDQENLEALCSLNSTSTGAGQHSEKLKDKYQKLCKEACKKGIESLITSGGALEAVVDATIVLENSALTNAGYGSNLTFDGKVECDASIMDGSTLHFGAVGAISGVKNPIVVAKRLCQQQSLSISHGRIPPSFLVGSGAHMWAKEMGIQTIPADNLISVKAEKVYKHYKRKVEDHSCETQRLTKKRMDTVGAVCVDEFGNVASACSSGGIILKYSGRVGQAGVWGCGIWAQNGENSIGVSTTGCGEHLIRTTLARTIAEAVSNAECPTTSLYTVMKKDFIDSRFLSQLEQKLGGAIAIRYASEEKVGDLLWSHSTNTMIVGYMNSTEHTAVSHMSILPLAEVGKKAVVEGICFKFPGVSETATCP